MSLLLYSGTMSAFFIFDGNIPSLIDLLKIISRGTMIWVDIDFSRLLLMLSYPLQVLFGRLFINVNISCHVVE